MSLGTSLKIKRDNAAVYCLLQNSVSNSDHKDP